MNRLILLAAFASSALSQDLTFEEPVSRIAFGSCFREQRPAPIFEAIQAANPEVFLWMGDNIYGDTQDMEILRQKYQAAKNLPAYVTLRESCRIFGTWDDHDYGVNDGGADHPMRTESQQEMLDFLDEPAASLRRSQAGVQQVVDLGPPEKRVRILLLDTRYHRDPIGSDGTVLGEVQWKWLEEQLVGSKAAVHVIVSSIQVLPSEHPFEKWAKFPKDRARLLDLLARNDVPPVILLSGDRHLAELSIEPKRCGYPLLEVTSSSMNSGGGGSDSELNVLRIGANFRAENFGTLTIDWTKTKPIITAALRDIHGAPQRAITFVLER